MQLHPLLLCAGTWTLGLSKGTYGETDIGESAFNTAFWASEHHIVKRVCASCSSDYQEVYYRRYTNDVNVYDVYDTLKENWFSADNTLNSDFGIFSSYADGIPCTLISPRCKTNKMSVPMCSHCPDQPMAVLQL